MNALQVHTWFFLKKSTSDANDQGEMGPIHSTVLPTEVRQRPLFLVHFLHDVESLWWVYFWFIHFHMYCISFTLLLLVILLAIWICSPNVKSVTYPRVMSLQVQVVYVVMTVKEKKIRVFQSVYWTKYSSKKEYVRK